jgi:cytochrome c biogenesis protein CcmG/thiol:disulfide interchange protein DsbE
VPETFIVGRDGTILHKHVGPLTEASLAGPFGAALEAAARP